MNVWVEAARPRTLPASAAPVLVGTAAGATVGGLVWWRFALALLVAIAVAAAAGLALAATVSWWLLLVGLGSFVALLGYSGGPRPYASEGLGEVFVFLFF